MNMRRDKAAIITTKRFQTIAFLLMIKLRVFLLQNKRFKLFGNCYGLFKIVRADYSDFNPIPPGHIRALNIRELAIWSKPTLSSLEIAIDLKFVVVLVQYKRTKVQEKCLDDFIIFLNDVIRFAKFGPKSNCPYPLEDKTLQVENFKFSFLKSRNQKSIFIKMLIQ